MFSGYIKDFQVEDPHRVGKITVQLLGRINDCRALTYRQDIKANNIESYTKNKLPTHQVSEPSFLYHFTRPLDLELPIMVLRYWLTFVA